VEIIWFKNNKIRQILCHHSKFKKTFWENEEERERKKHRYRPKYFCIQHFSISTALTAFKLADSPHVNGDNNPRLKTENLHLVPV
jgi:hypothetical protein